MISIEIKGGEDDKKIEKQKEVLFLIGIQLKKIIENFDFKDLLKIDLTEIAVDLQFKSQSKKISTRHILDWLKGKTLTLFFILLSEIVRAMPRLRKNFYSRLRYNFWLCW